MTLLDEYQVFLLDFDGLLVNTEQLQFEAYRRLCHNHGYELPWSFAEYWALAQTSSDGVKNAIADKLGGTWEARYAEKREIYKQVLEEAEIELMPGAGALLQALAARNIKRAVVTHSPLEHLKIIRERLPILDTIPLWVTREDYTQPKPNPESYLKAIELVADEDEKVIGFEDSLRGLAALKGTRAQPVLVGPHFEADGRTLHISSLREALADLAAV